MRRILIISYHFYPSAAVGGRRMSELARYLAARGDQVTVLSGLPDPASMDEALSERVAACRVIGLRDILRVDALLIKAKAVALAALAPFRNVPDPRALPRVTVGQPSGAASGESPARRLRRYVISVLHALDRNKGWTLHAVWRLRRMRGLEQFDVVISSGPPFSPHFAAMLARRWFGARWILDYRDPWFGNEATCPPQENSGLRAMLERNSERAALRRADAVVAASWGITREIDRNHGIPADQVTVLLNGYDGTPVRGSSPTGTLTLLYAGALYLNRNPVPLMDAIAALIEEGTFDRTKVKFIMIGNCRTWRDVDLVQWIDERSMHDVIQILPFMKPSELGPYYERANVLVNFAQGQPDQIPGKVYEYIASGKEMLVLTEAGSDTARVCREAGLGEAVEPGDPAALSRALERFYEFYVVNASAFTPPDDSIRRFSRDGQNAAYAARIDEVVAGG
jgi:glycosyltransferase involved in cell wall biosynthesis